MPRLRRLFDEGFEQQDQEEPEVPSVTAEGGTAPAQFDSFVPPATFSQLQAEEPVMPPPTFLPPGERPSTAALRTAEPGFLGAQETIGVGSSITPAQRDQYLADARAAGVPESFISSFIAGNPLDYNRIIEAYNSQQTGVPGGGGGGRPSFGDAGNAAALSAQFQGMMEALRAILGQQLGPGNLPDVTPLPLIEVPGANLSPGIDAALVRLLGGRGSTPSNLLEPELPQFGFQPGGGRSSDVFAGGPGGFDEAGGGGFGGGGTLDQSIEQALRSLVDPESARARRNLRLTAAREDQALAQRGLIEDLRGSLADRGLVSLPGVTQGAELEGTRRIGQAVAERFAPEISRIIAQEDEAFDRHQVASLQLATGYSRDQANQLLQTINLAQNRQAMMADIALRSLDQNRQWNQFLAQYGLDREKLMNDIQQGRVDSVMPVLMAFLNLLGQSRGGFI